ncbi:MazG-like family protein [Streptomyces gamaensis]|uniref:MazG-like family protein n=1 Tax=Streptomyces gamaensis TaxID=1763542 RepID=A0ABW0Z389_9ACTN
MDNLWDNITKLSAVCRKAGEHLPEAELTSLQVGKVAEEAGEAMHALHGLKGLTTCGDDHGWTEVQNDLVGAVIAALLAMHYIAPTAPARPSTRSSTGVPAAVAKPQPPDPQPPDRRPYSRTRPSDRVIVPSSTTPKGR